MTSLRPVALITGVGRTVGIGAGIAERLASAGWDIATTHLEAYDDRMPWGRKPGDVEAVHARLRDAGAASVAIEADLSDIAAPARVIDEATSRLGRVSALILSHCESVDSSLMDTSVESFDRHFAVNVRASMLLIQEFSRRLGRPAANADPAGRIVALTSDHVVNNLPYGASKGALDRLVIGASRELGDQGVTANVINPGPVDTGWMTTEMADAVRAETPAGRLGTPSDVANLVAFLCSAAGGWVNGQLLHSDGGWSVKGG
ncbi:SDR family oxidoreductase [Spelaeicoccus albus]|uniref:3-oxoacyl-[acyl-carrier protein] reductase n=1 Tax=Spelaeicoccus albus TaxID=1280376 RepID=A0A7Z0D3V6_9MICO|nr:SDR family oxidoreductase [Spelaeicoccus albus]NYI68365.1 3-oxoacyl-[acyl-carrier protein] reductase [Spelaeicoccus albus]